MPAAAAPAARPDASAPSRRRGRDSGDGEPSRRCFVTGEVRPRAELVRFVVDPAGTIVPDVAARLPGRGLWLTARRDIVATAVAKRLFARAARAQVAADEGLADRVERLLAARCGEVLGLARRAGQAVAGFEKVRALAASGDAAVLVEAADGGADSRGKLVALAPDVPVIDRLTSSELSAALGREHVVHAALLPGRLAASFVDEAARLGGFRTRAASA
jgi:uncharacterized protein